LLELVRIHDMTAWVRRASGKRPAVPRWNGGRMPLSTTLADAVVQQLALADEGHYDTPELQCVRPLLDIQQQWSALPTPQTLLAETAENARRLASVPLSLRRPPCAPGPGQPDRLARRAACAAHLFHRGERLRL
jgi:Lhr-like helicase